MEKRYRIKIVYERSSDQFLGRYKDHEINVSRDEPTGNWYIVVTAPSGVYGYDGWWRDSVHRTMDEAIEEALIGAGLLPRQHGK